MRASSRSTAVVAICSRPGRHRGQRRRGVRGLLDVVEADDRDLPRDVDAARVQDVQGAEREGVVEAEHGVDLDAGVQQPFHRLGARRAVPQTRLADQRAGPRSDRPPRAPAGSPARAARPSPRSRPRARRPRRCAAARGRAGAGWRRGRPRRCSWSRGPRDRRRCARRAAPSGSRPCSASASCGPSSSGEKISPSVRCRRCPESTSSSRSRTDPVCSMRTVSPRASAARMTESASSAKYGQRQLRHREPDDARSGRGAGSAPRCSPGTRGRRSPPRPAPWWPAGCTGTR